MLRKRAGLSTVEVGERVGLSNGSISQWENDGVKSYDCDRLKAFAELYEVQVWELFRIAAAHAADGRRFVLEEPVPGDYLIEDSPDVAELIMMVRRMTPAQSSGLLHAVKMLMS
ncbi:hypothetical protein IGB42_02619 [Andreprevotia sp. IGB-42]|nr:hypothetical protein IGB42_02619 [Andreprevotia sp. IGB-42]